MKNMENEFGLLENVPVGGTHFCTKTRFDVEAKGNSEMPRLVRH